MDRCLIMFVLGVGLGLRTAAESPYLSMGLTLLFALLVTLLPPTAVPRARTVATLVTFLFCGITVATANINWQHHQQQQLTQFESLQPMTVVVTSLPVKFNTHIRFVGKVIRGHSLDKGFLGAPRLRFSWYGKAPQHLQLGQLWQLNVKVKPARNYWNWGSTDYLLRLSRQGITALATVQSGQLQQAGKPVRARIAERLAQHPDQQGAILAALSVGVRHLMSAEQRRHWQYNGLTHALAISGLHLSLVAWAGLLLGRVIVSRVLSWRCKAGQLEQLSVQRLSFLFALLVAFGYAWLADFAIATVRALIMFTVLGLHQILALRISPWQLVLRTVAVLLLIDPLAWLDVGFWLSVSALLTIFTTIWRWQQAGGAGLVSLVRLQLMFLIIMAPLSLHWFGGISLLAPLVNLLVLPVISLWLLPLALSGTLAEIFYAHQFADNLWFLASLPLQVIAPFLKFTAALDFNWWQPQMDIPLTTLVLVMVLTLLPIGRVFYKWVLLGSLPLVSYAFSVSHPRDQTFYLHVLDVGQSQAVVIERAGRAWLIDTAIGYNSGYSLAASVIEPFLQARQLQLEAVWVSHKDRDHSGGMEYLAQRYPDILWFGALTSQPCRQGMEGSWNGIQWTVLWPEVGPEVGPKPGPSQQAGSLSSNNASCVLYLRYKNFTVLLPGDIEFSAEREIAESLGFPAVDLLLAPHHGSRTSSGWLLLKQAQPSLILISNGDHKGYNFPHQSTTNRYRQMQRSWFSSKDYGQLSVASNGYQWRLLLPFEEKRGRLIYRDDD
ncbi:DNA internalization-related competence protein ComEC/Rec2 [Idiomarina seosinensis]|uniref:DNA internalization-related competence protein ComEC/Rec2 n=1 Tax=Idiomarina seosinensis TaxID=281739 RepID=UPI00384A956B